MRTVIIIKYLVLDLFDLLQRRVMFLPCKWCVDDILYTLKEKIYRKRPTAFCCRLNCFLLSPLPPAGTDKL